MMSDHVGYLQVPMTRAMLEAALGAAGGGGGAEAPPVPPGAAEAPGAAEGGAERDPRPYRLGLKLMEEANEAYDGPLAPETATSVMTDISHLVALSAGVDPELVDTDDDLVLWAAYEGGLFRAVRQALEDDDNPRAAVARGEAAEAAPDEVDD